MGFGVFLFCFGWLVLGVWLIGVFWGGGGCGFFVLLFGWFFFKKNTSPTIAIFSVDIAKKVS